MSILGLAVGVALISFFISLIIFPVALSIAKKKGIVDNPNARKLQRVPVPILGGIPVFLGILVAMAFGISVMDTHLLWVTILAMTIMLFIGTWDDIKDLPALFRFIVEMLLVWSIMAINDIYIDSFHGLWGLDKVTYYLSLPLSLIAGVGIINAVNLIDGVDGYSSSYGIFANLVFSIIFIVNGEYALGMLALACMTALIPFFFHNVFGRKTKMFFGDGGTLMLGMVMTTFVFTMLSSNSKCSIMENHGIGIVALALALLTIPVFDTLRVMAARIVRGNSPFHPDKTHLHHLFIEMKFSHIGTTVAIMLMQLTILIVWLIAWLMGASVNVQFYLVVLLGVGVTFVFYRFMKIQQTSGELDEDGIPMGTAIWHFMCKIGMATHMERNKAWKWLERLVDGKLGGDK